METKNKIGFKDLNLELKIAIICIYALTTMLIIPLLLYILSTIMFIVS